MPSRRIGCVWIPHFPVWAHCRSSPELASRPLIVRGTPSEAGRTICDASERAFAAGVRLGMTLREAQARCPEAVVLDLDASTVAAAQEQLLTLLERWSPDVEDVRPGVALFGTQSGDEAELARQVVAAVETELGAPARVGLASTRFCARVAAANGQPVLVVLPGREAAFLAPLPVTHLPGLAPWLWRLRFLGITTIGDYATRLPYNDVRTRYGPEAAQAHLLARGLDPGGPWGGPLRPRRLPELPAAVHAFEPPETRLEPLVFVLKQQLDTLCAQLQRDGWVCGEVRLRCACEGGKDVTIACRPAEPTASSARLTDLLRWQIEQRQRRAEQTKRQLFGGGLLRVELQLGALSRAIGLALDLFAGSRADRRSVLSVIERLETLLGPGGIRRAILADGRRPEEMFAWQPFRPVEETPSRSHRKSERTPASPDVRGQPLPLAPLADGRPLSIDSQADDLHFPALRLLDPPRSVQVKERDGMPAAVAAGHGFEAVIAVAGPWPLGENWWLPAAVDRVYFQVQTRPGRVYLLYRDGDAWWLQGIFD